MKTHSNYELLIEKLDQFIRKFYINKVVRGLLYTIGAVIMLFLVFSTLEYFFYFGKGMRKFLFFGFILATLGMLFYWVFDPLLRYFKLGKTISHEQAAHIVGNHFADVKDKLLNVLQLRKQADSISERSLIEASIEQKTSNIKLVPFKNAIDLSKNKKYLRYALPPALLLLILIFAAPSLIKDSTHRIINNDKEFEKAAPFQFEILNDRLKAVQFEDYLLEIKTAGDAIPDEAYIEINKFQYRLSKREPGVFSYTFKNVQDETSFRLFSGNVSSTNKVLEVLVKPNLSDLNIDLDYPAYIGRRDESIANTGDLIIPEGTKVTWNLNSIHTDKIAFSFNGETPEEATRQSEDFFYHNRKVRKNESYKIYIQNNNIQIPDSILYSINVIKDQYPTINVEKYSDSIDNTLLYFVGSASDDYGLRELTFNYTVSSEDGNGDRIQSINLERPVGRSVNYDHVFDIKDLELLPGDKVSFYFEVKDNDLVNGSKVARTGVMSFEKPSLEEIKEEENLNEEAIKKDLEESIKESKKIQEELKKMRDKLLQKKEMNWQDKKELEQLLEKQKELQQSLQDAKEKMDENMKNMQENSPEKEEMLQKQEKMQKMMEEMMNPETMELMEKIQELLQELNKEDALQMMEEMEMNEETMEKNMERLLNLYKQLEMEKEIQDMAEKLEELAEKQEELAEETEKEESPQEELQKKQEEINEEFEEAQEKMEELEKQNEELNPPKNLDEDNQEKMEEISDDLNESQEQLQQNQNNNASKSQKNAAQKMKNMASQMMESMQGGEQEQMAEDLQALRQLLENLVFLSFDQENLYNSVRRTVSSTPKYVELVQDQFKLKNDFQLIEDSLTALSTRVAEIESFVTEKVTEVKRNMGNSLEELEERLVPEASESQRRTMKNVNDLALMLSESMENMQQQMANMMGAGMMCNKPGGKGSGKDGNVPMDKITKGQQGVGEQLQNMGEKQKSGEGLSSKDFAQAAARQAALRKALQEMRDSKGEQGKGGKELQEIIDQMDKIEEDLVNKRLDSEMFMRQQEILTRLLEAEKAEQQREYDNKRKAEQAQAKRRELPPSLQEYLKKREAEIEMYKTISPELKPYYKFLVDEYYRALKGEN